MRRHDVTVNEPDEAAELRNLYDFNRQIPSNWQKPPLPWTDGQKSRPQRKDAKERHEALCDLISEIADASEPNERDGYKWTMPAGLEAWARTAGMSERTFRRMISVEPIRKRVVNVDGNNQYVLRVGAEDFGDEQKAQVLVKLWKKELNIKNVSGRDFGCMVGLAEVWPDPWQGRILIHTVRRWSDFKAAVSQGIKIAQEIDATSAEDRASLYVPEARLDHNLDVARANMPDNLDVKFHRYPSLTVLRRFWYVAEVVFRDGMYERGWAVPDLPTWRDAPADWCSNSNWPE